MTRLLKIWLDHPIGGYYLSKMCLSPVFVHVCETNRMFVGRVSDNFVPCLFSKDDRLLSSPMTLHRLSQNDMGVNLFSFLFCFFFLLLFGLLLFLTTRLHVLCIVRLSIFCFLLSPTIKQMLLGIAVMWFVLELGEKQIWTKRVCVWSNPQIIPFFFSPTARPTFLSTFLALKLSLHECEERSHFRSSFDLFFLNGKKQHWKIHI